MTASPPGTNLRRPWHRLVWRVLGTLNGALLADAKCYFGGGTRIAMELDEFRESVDIDFLCADRDGYRTLRNTVTERSLGDIVSGDYTLMRDVRADMYGIRTFLRVDGQPIKFEIIAEGRISLASDAAGLRHAYSRYLALTGATTAGLPTRPGRERPVTREDSQKNALYLRPEGRRDHLVALPDGADRAAAIVAAMDSIEEDYPSLRGTLPKGEYQALDNDVLGDLLRKLNPDELKHVSGDVTATSEAVFAHVSHAYPTVPSPYYDGTAAA